MGRTLLLAALVLAVPTVSRAAPRFPLWPTEIDRAAAPLYSRGTERQASERQRADAVVALDEFATETIRTPLLWALEDPSAQVRREALRLCFERALIDCIDGAATLYNDGLEPSLRIAALKVLAMDPGPRSASILIAALRDNNEAIRAQAAEYLGTAPLQPAMRDKTRAALLAKLPDVSAIVRRAAVHSLGLLGPGEGTLAVARVLDDPEPAVSAAAAEALGRMRDDRVVPALRRAVQAPNEPIVSKAHVEALAVLETAEGEHELLALLDDPPPGLNARQVADALSRRPNPGAPLIEGLIERLREPPLGEACLHALLVLGERARPGITAVLARGVEAPIALELQRLLDALAVEDLPSKPATRDPDAPLPDDDDPGAWKAALSQAGADRRTRAALALGERSPPWLGPMAAAMLADASSPAPRRAWLIALARAASTRPLGPQGPTVVARLTAWSRDPVLAEGDRCLAVLALGTAAMGERRHAAASALRDALSDARAQLRACAAAAAPKAGLGPDDLEGLLVDPDPRVRATAALTVASYGAQRLSRSIATRLAVLHYDDESGEVRQTAEFARRRAAQAGGSAAPGLVAIEAPVAAWADPLRWAEQPVAGGDRSVWLPVIGFGSDRWIVVPGEPDATPKSPKYSLAGTDPR